MDEQLFCMRCLKKTTHIYHVEEEESGRPIAWSWTCLQCGHLKRVEWEGKNMMALKKQVALDIEALEQADDLIRKWLKRMEEMELNEEGDEMYQDLSHAQASIRDVRVRSYPQGRLFVERQKRSRSLAKDIEFVLRRSEMNYYEQGATMDALAREKLERVLDELRAMESGRRE